MAEFGNFSLDAKLKMEQKIKKKKYVSNALV